MQIVVKVKLDSTDDVTPTIARSVSAALARSDVGEVEVTRVFPGLTKGNRARMFMVNLSDSLSEQEVRDVVEQLGRQEMLEYARLPSPRRPF